MFKCILVAHMVLESIYSQRRAGRALISRCAPVIAGERCLVVLAFGWPWRRPEALCSRIALGEPAVHMLARF